MKTARLVYHLARADFLERVRRYSFLILLGLAFFLAYQAAIGNLALQLGPYRGEYNSDWVGAMMVLNTSFFLGWFGFYLVKGSVGRDRETGVGQILATTPLTRPHYLLGKWLSNFGVLAAMTAALAVAGLIIQVWKGESAQFDLLAYLAPFALLALPCLALVAAAAVLFETIPFLQGGFGNVVYLFAFIVSLPLIIENLNGPYAAFDPLGVSLLEREMGAVARAAHADYQGGFSIGTSERVTGTFLWNGMDWTASMLLARFSLAALAVLMTLLSALFFDRFDPARARPKRPKGAAPAQVPALTPALELALAPSPETALAPPHQAASAVRLTPLGASARRFSFTHLLFAELKLLLKGQPWWWYAIAGGLIIACLANPSATTRQAFLPLAWAWPVLVWSAIGSRERRSNTYQMAFSSASPLWRQLPAQWLAGWIITLLFGAGALLRLLIDGNASGALAALSGSIFIPSLALACGVWSGSSKLFEIVYILILYLGPLNKILELDFTGANSNGRPEFFLPFLLALVASAFMVRARQIRN